MANWMQMPAKNDGSQLSKACRTNPASLIENMKGIIRVYNRFLNARTSLWPMKIRNHNITRPKLLYDRP